jgi:2-polyprenyl-3-methyl-5-hydroxy-6-metoxy-1,4-benzoquinol methylase
MVLEHWRNVLKPSGALILTTPNRHRHLNRINRSDTPFGPDHFREFTPEELRRVLEENGFRITYLTGLYVELCINFFRPRPRVDLLQTRFNRPAFKPVMAALVPLGRLMPKRSLELIVIARRS